MHAFYAEAHLDLRPECRAALRTLLESPETGCVLIIRAAARPVGYCVMTFGYSLERAGRIVLIDELFILPEARSQGTGTAAMKAALQQAMTAGCRAVFLEVDRSNPRARMIYERLGFIAHPRDVLSRELPPAGGGDGAWEGGTPVEITSPA
jgi:GNAT superfamily N-acetyltransferase